MAAALPAFDIGTLACALNDSALAHPTFLGALVEIVNARSSWERTRARARKGQA